jgi:hypothetical protein
MLPAALGTKTGEREQPSCSSLSCSEVVVHPWHGILLSTEQEQTISTRTVQTRQEAIVLPVPGKAGPKTVTHCRIPLLWPF